MIARPLDALVVLDDLREADREPLGELQEHTSYGQDATFTTSEAFAEPLNVVAPSTTGGSQSENSSTPTGSGTSSVAPGETSINSPHAGTTKLSEQKLTRALKQCQKKPRGKRAGCERRVRVNYARAANARGPKR